LVLGWKVRSREPEEVLILMGMGEWREEGRVWMDARMGSLEVSEGGREDASKSRGFDQSEFSLSAM